MSPQLFLALLALFIAVAVATGVVSWQVVESRNPVRRRLRQLTRPDAVAAPAPTLLFDEPTTIARRLARWVPTSPGKIRKVGPRLAAIGYPGPSAVVVFSAVQMLCALVVGFATVAMLGGAWWRVATVLSVAGFLLPDVWVRRAYKRRQREIQNGLPDALDLCIICIEAGCSLDHAIAKTTDQLALAYPALAAELNLVRAETRAGKPKTEAFRNFAERTQVEEVRSLVGTLVQTERFGTSIGQALRVHASSSRNRRRLRAEERAAKSGTKLVFPLVLCLFPAFYVITLGPAVLEVMQNLAKLQP
jgi:tight adherence protein C